jgi:peroxiredoxin Q/BCP
VTSEGDRAPEFSLQADDGSTVTLESVAGKNVVLFFYPKDNTSG